MTRRTRSLRWMIGGIYFFIMVTILGALALYFSYRIEEHYMATMSRIVRGQAKLAAYVVAPLVRSDEKKLEAAIRGIHVQTRETTVRRISLLEIDGSVIKTYPPSLSPTTGVTPEVREALELGAGQDIRVNPDTDEETLYVAAPVQLRHEDILAEVGASALPYPTTESPSATSPLRHDITWALLVLTVPTTDVQEAVGHIRVALSLAFVGVLFVLLFINAGVSNFIVHPLAILSAAAERFAGGNLSEHVEPTGADEIATLGAAFNKMAGELRRTIDRLAEERAQAEAILASMADGVLVTDTERAILQMNRSAEQICGIEGHVALGRKIDEVMRHPELTDLLTKTLESGLPLKHQITFSAHADRAVEAHLAPVKLDGRQLGAVIALYDVTHQRQLEDERRDFVANVSHELRTPVASIRAMAETLMDAGGDEPEMTSDFLHTITTESERLTVLLDNLLRLSRIESDRRLIVPEDTDLGALIRHVAERLIAPITAKNQQLILEVPDCSRAVVDRDAVVQILVNLLDNARKYTPDGGVISVFAKCDDVVRLRVCDTGIGIPPEDRERIFERFYRVEKGRSHEQGGSGLGLAIVRHLVELHGGRIFVESEVGAGTCFTVMLPQPTPPQAPEETVEKG